MKKVLFGFAAVAMLGLVACSSKDKAAEDTAVVDSDTVNVEVATDTIVAVDSINDSTAAVTVATETVETVNAQ